MNITSVPEEELRKDLQDSYYDINICEAVLALGIFEYSDGEFVHVRLITNQHIVKVIEAELARRDKLIVKESK